MEHTKCKLEINDFSLCPIQIGKSPEEIGGYYVEDLETRGTIAIVPDFKDKNRNALANAEHFALCWNSYDSDQKKIEDLVEALRELFRDGCADGIGEARLENIKRLLRPDAV